jgi:hypothetical protein
MAVFDVIFENQKITLGYPRKNIVCCGIIALQNWPVVSNFSVY